MLTNHQNLMVRISCIYSQFQEDIFNALYHNVLILRIVLLLKL